jgi:hypothetical protein
MTTTMKVETIAYYILKGFSFVCGFLGFLGMIGFAGNEALTTFQFFMYELHAVGLIGLSYLVYQVSELIVVDLLRRARLMNYKGKAPRYSQQLRKASEDYDAYCSMYN